MDSTHDKRFDWRKVPQDRVDSERVFLLMLRHCEDRVRITGEYTGAADSIDRFFGRLVAFTEMMPKRDGGPRLDRERLDLVE